MRKRQFPLVGRVTGYASWVHLDDAASATVLAGGLCGGEAAGAVPKWLARLLAGEVAVVMMAEGRGFSNTKAKRKLGWELRCPSWRQGFKEGLA